ncbi:YejL family protein [Thalassotalea agarivorans]|uniref:Uncharacterized protein n=1 Tax=Thalassotalea agarivorans TaxID=349064 RepID=A0A1I0F1R6_THASX|nr:DUF1414 domain-containing protein [Thalassotalea agarivorans]SET51947.1 hypothetical protein SAMN05660429_02031 [Thalassotalea agarivorans]
MPIVSKYPTERVEKIIKQLMDVLIDEKAEADLSLMCLGNTITEVISQQVPAELQESIVNNFTQALQQSIIKQ